MNTRHRQEYTAAHIGVPGILLFGHNLSQKADRPLQLHIHPHCAEIVVVARGAECYFADGERYPVSQGEAFLSFPDQPHGSGGNCTTVSEFYWMQMDLSTGENFLGLSRENGERLRQAILGQSAHLLSVDAEGISLVKRCYFALQNEEDPLYCAGLFSCLLSRIFLVGRVEKGMDGLASRVRDCVEQQLDEPILLSELAAHFGFSESGLQHKFRSATGYSLRDYINTRRVERAKVLLKEGVSVTEAAMALGFNSADYFSTVFRKYTAMTPTEWAKKPLA